MSRALTLGPIPVGVAPRVAGWLETRNDRVYWRASILALASALQSDRRQTADDMTERTCGACRQEFLADVRIYPASCVFYCSGCQDRPAEHDDYWFALCLLGTDPEQRDAAAFMTHARRDQLIVACFAAGLRFGELADPATGGW